MNIKNKTKQKTGKKLKSNAPNSFFSLRQGLMQPRLACTLVCILKSMHL